MEPAILSDREGLLRVIAIQQRAATRRSALVALTGIDACGKSHVAARWRDRLQRRGLRVALIGADGWLNLPSKRFGGVDPAQHFYTHALRLREMFSELVLPLRRRRSIRVAADFTEETANAYRKELYEFRDIDIILLEGIFLLKRTYRRFYDAAFWIECSFETALERALRRAQEGLPPPQTEQAYRSIYFPAQEIHLRRDDPKKWAAGILINDPRLDQ